MSSALERRRRAQFPKADVNARQAVGAAFETPKSEIKKMSPEGDNESGSEPPPTLAPLPSTTSKKVARNPRAHDGGESAELLKFLKDAETTAQKEPATPKSFMDFDDDDVSLVSPNPFASVKREWRAAVGGGSAGNSNSVGGKIANIRKGQDLEQEVKHEGQGRVEIFKEGESSQKHHTSVLKDAGKHVLHNAFSFSHLKKKFSTSAPVSARSDTTSDTTSVTTRDTISEQNSKTSSQTSRSTKITTSQASDEQTPPSDRKSTTPGAEAALFSSPTPNVGIAATASKALPRSPVVPVVPLKSALRSARSSDTVRTVVSNDNAPTPVPEMRKSRYQLNLETSRELASHGISWPYHSPGLTQSPHDSARGVPSPNFSKPYRPARATSSPQEPAPGLPSPSVSTSLRFRGLPTSPLDPEWDDAIQWVKQQVARENLDEQSKVREAKVKAKRKSKKEAQDEAQLEGKVKQAELAKAGMRLIIKRGEAGYTTVKPMREMSQKELAMVGAALYYNQEKQLFPKGLKSIFKHVGHKRAMSDVIVHQHELHNEELRKEIEAAKATGLTTPTETVAKKAKADASYEEAMKALQLDDSADRTDQSQHAKPMQFLNDIKIPAGTFDAEEDDISFDATEPDESVWRPAPATSPADLARRKFAELNPFHSSTSSSGSESKSTEAAEKESLESSGGPAQSRHKSSVGLGITDDDHKAGNTHLSGLANTPDSSGSSSPRTVYRFDELTPSEPEEEVITIKRGAERSVPKSESVPRARLAEPTLIHPAFREGIRPSMLSANRMRSGFVRERAALFASVPKEPSTSSAPSRHPFGDDFFTPERLAYQDARMEDFTAEVHGVKDGDDNENEKDAKIEGESTHIENMPTSPIETHIDSVVADWQRASTVPSLNLKEDNMLAVDRPEVQRVRLEVGLAPLTERSDNNPKHPNHPYAWDTDKIMCRGAHNPAETLPGLPECHSMKVCKECNAYCCAFANILAATKLKAYDAAGEYVRRTAREKIEKLQVFYPAGVEDFDTFLPCDECGREVCPSCASVCTEEGCSKVVCARCVVAGKCDMHV